MKMAILINILLYILIFVNSSFEYCQTCLDGEVHMWGLNVDGRPVSGTFTTCWGILDCNEALCAVNGVGVVTNVVLKLNTTATFHKKYTQKYMSGMCTEGKVFVLGVDSNYKTVADGTCSGLISCNEVICTVNNTPNVSFILITPTHG